MRRLWLTSLVGAIGIGLVAACSAGLGARSASPVAIPFDQQFIDMMVPHHEGALEMAKIAEMRAARPEIQAMARDILATQAAEIDQMKRWRAAWYGSADTPPMARMPMVEGMTMRSGGGHGGHAGTPSNPAQTMDMAADVAALRSAGEPFERAFIDAMISHHEDAVAAARAATNRAERPEIKQLARAIEEAQTREIDQLRRWRTEWFGSR